MFLYELVYWLVAGLLDVRAERAITWPEKQEIAELQLKFVKLSKKASPLKVAIISAAPLAAGVAVIWIIAINVFDLPTALDHMKSGLLTDVSLGIQHIVSTPDVWLWVYFAFTISNTMIPSSFKEFQGFRLILTVFFLGMIGLFALGIGDEVLVNGLTPPLTAAFSLLSSTFAIIIGLNVFVTFVLALVENSIEWITGDSATFKEGRLIAMRRDEVKALRAEEARRARQQRGKSVSTAPGGPPSVYKFPLPIPGAPGKEPVTQGASVIVSPETTPSPTFGSRPAPSLITGTATEKAPPTSPSPALLVSKPTQTEENEEESASAPASDIKFSGLASRLTLAPIPPRETPPAFTNDDDYDENDYDDDNTT